MKTDLKVLLEPRHFDCLSVLHGTLRQVYDFYLKFTDRRPNLVVVNSVRALCLQEPRLLFQALGQRGRRTLFGEMTQMCLDDLLQCQVVRPGSPTVQDVVLEWRGNGVDEDLHVSNVYMSCPTGHAALLAAGFWKELPLHLS